MYPAPLERIVLSHPLIVFFSTFLRSSARNSKVVVENAAIELKLLHPNWLVEIGPNGGFVMTERPLTSDHRSTLLSWFTRKVVHRC
jgi:hypothetical protein